MTDGSPGHSTQQNAEVELEGPTDSSIRSLRRRPRVGKSLAPLRPWNFAPRVGEEAPADAPKLGPGMELMGLTLDLCRAEGLMGATQSRAVEATWQGLAG